jgi:hypothetical protein
MFAAALAMAMTCPKKGRLDFEPHAAAKTTTSNHFFHGLLLCSLEFLLSAPVSDARLTFPSIGGNVAGSKRSPLFELAHFLVRLDHVASFIVNANHGVL